MCIPVCRYPPDDTYQQLTWQNQQRQKKETYAKSVRTTRWIYFGPPVFFCSIWKFPFTSGSIRIRFICFVNFLETCFAIAHQSEKTHNLNYVNMNLNLAYLSSIYVRKALVPYVWQIFLYRLTNYNQHSRLQKTHFPKN